jgi:hypothetical protein
MAIASDVSIFRLYTLRVMYLVIVLGLAATIWPRLVQQPADWPLMNSVVISVLAAVSLLALLGLRYPVQLIPILLFELLWKSIWLLAVALPRHLGDGLDAAQRQTVFECTLGVVLVPLALPWRYVIDHYVRRRGDRWR